MSLEKKRFVVMEDNKPLFYFDSIEECDNVLDDHIENKINSLNLEDTNYIYSVDYNDNSYSILRRLRNSITSYDGLYENYTISETK